MPISSRKWIPTAHHRNFTAQFYLATSIPEEFQQHLPSIFLYKIIPLDERHFPPRLFPVLFLFVFVVKYPLNVFMLILPWILNCDSGSYSLIRLALIVC